MSQPSPFNPVVIAPTYNNARTLGAVLAHIRSLGFSIIAVNDGSTDATPAILADLAWRDPNVTIVTHRQNRGKAAALHTGFTAARAAGFTHAATIDTDGQLDPGQLPALIDAARENPGAFVLGVRDDTRPDYPARSRAGRRVSNFLVWLESGARVGDSQCGFRVYPLDFVHTVHATAGHFGFETEIITRAGWAHTPLREVLVTCVYLPPGQRVSHFRPWMDSFRAVAMHVRLVFRALNPWPHPQWLASTKPPDPRPWHRRLLDWINPMRAWRDLQQDEQIGRTGLSTALAVGVLIANLPVYPLQTLVALLAAKRLHLHPVPVVVGSQLSTPPLNVALIAGAIAIGHFLLHGHWLYLADVRHLHWRDVFPSLLLDWTLGGLLLGLVLGAVTFFAAQWLFRLVPKKPAHTRARPTAHPPAPAPTPASAGRQ